MKTTQIIAIAILLLILTGCDNTDGQVELKEPKKELSEFPERKNWSVTDVEGYGE